VVAVVAGGRRLESAFAEFAREPGQRPAAQSIAFGTERW
jgi:hypothetical protein